MLSASAWPITTANLILAQLYDKGVEGILYVLYLPIDTFRFDYLCLFWYRQQDWRKAADFYEKYMHLRETEVNNRDENHETSTESDEVDASYCLDECASLNNEYDIVARLAHLYRFGEHGLECDYSKAGNRA